MTADLQRILCVEDDPDIQVVVRLALESIGGFSVKICASGEDALRDAEHFAPQMILLDVMMPGMDGPSTLRALRTRPALVDVPVAFMTAKVHPRELDQLRSLGACDVIAKPFDPMALPARVRLIWEQYGGQ